MDHVLYQLADSAFPAGGFAHSLGLEALRATGRLADERALALRLDELAWHTAYASLPFLADAHRGDPADADAACDRFLSSQVANRASRAQGRAFALAAEAMLGRRIALPFGHLPVMLGAVLAGANIVLADARELAMYCALRSAVSAAIRLGIVGPLRAQRLLLDVAPTARGALDATREATARDARTISPLVEIAQAAHDRLYTRLFQS